MVNRLVPSAEIWSSRADFDDSDKPKTPTSEAMPMAMPNAERTERSLRAASERSPTRTASSSRSRLDATGPTVAT